MGSGPGSCRFCVTLALRMVAGLVASLPGSSPRTATYDFQGVRMKIAHMVISATSALTILISVAAAAPKVTKSAKPAAVSSTCAKLTRDYENASKTLAANEAEGVGDNSAVRATMREAQNANTMSEAKFTLDLMTANKCKIPGEAPTSIRYLLPAMECRTAQLQRSNARASARLNDQAAPVEDPSTVDKCDRSKWERLERQ